MCWSLFTPCQKSRTRPALAGRVRQAQPGFHPVTVFSNTAIHHPSKKGRAASACASPPDSACLCDYGLARQWTVTGLSAFGAATPCQGVPIQRKRKKSAPSGRSRSVSGVRLGLASAVMVGILGAFIGGWLFAQLGVSVSGGLVGSIITALVGAIMLLLILRALKYR